MPNNQIANAINNYKKHSLDDFNEMLTYYNEQKNFSHVVELACLGFHADSSSNIIFSKSHYWNQYIQNFYNRGNEQYLSWIYQFIDNTLKINFMDITSFEELYICIENRNYIKGFGNLYFYDVSLRIGENLGIKPNNVYLQRGALKGYIKLFPRQIGINRCVGRNVFNKLHPGFNSFSPAQIENFLCVAHSNRWI